MRKAHICIELGYGNGLSTEAYIDCDNELVYVTSSQLPLRLAEKLGIGLLDVVIDGRSYGQLRGLTAFDVEVLV
jgi:hypothetical protein